MRNLILTIVCLFNFHILIFKCNGQVINNKKELTHADTLRGTYGASRDWWDVTKYDLDVKFDIPDSSISGSNIISFTALKNGTELQIDLQAPMIIDSIFYFTSKQYAQRTSTRLRSARAGSSKYIITNFRRDGNAYFIPFADLPVSTGISRLIVYYHGKPRKAINAPWDGGLIWKKDMNKNPWVTIACQELGASVWYPCKDHQQDEPDQAEMKITCPDTLVCVGNGRMRNKIVNGDGTATYDWYVSNPINNYCLIPYIGKYVHFGEVFKGEKGDLTMDYWVLDYNLQKAKKQFVDAARMMKAFEHWFGPYPFYEDGYKLVDAPHLGMEHQSATAYGNGYRMGYAGRDLSGSGWGLKWDFIIVHESGHEWFANNITSKDIADMWIHEGFTNYSETLFTEYFYGKEAGTEYIVGTRKGIKNDKPIIAQYGVNKTGSGDMYPKAGNMLHTIRQLVNDDEKFRQILRGLNKTFYHQTVETKQIEDYISKEANMDLSKVFDQYLRDTRIPKLQYKIDNGKLTYKWVNCIAGFNMPVKILIAADKYELVYPIDSETKTIAVEVKEDDFKVERNFYVLMEKL